jgi:hypothetical protein
MLSLKKKDDLINYFAILLFRYLTAASPNAASYRVIEAGTRLLARDYPFGGTISKQLLEQVERSAHGASAGVRAEVATAVILKAPGQKYAGPLFTEAHLYIRVAFVIPEPYVESRPVLLDEIVLEDEGFLFGICDDEIEGLHHRHHLVELRIVGMRGAEIRPNAVAQASRFAYVKYLPRLILEQINPRLRRQRFQLFL